MAIRILYQNEAEKSKSGDNDFFLLTNQICLYVGVALENEIYSPAPKPEPQAPLTFYHERLSIYSCAVLTHPCNSILSHDSGLGAGLYWKTCLTSISPMSKRNDLSTVKIKREPIRVCAEAYMYILSD